MIARPRDQNAVLAAVRQAFRAAHLDPDGEMEPITPLREIVRYHELRVDELPGLTRRSAEAFLYAVAGVQLGPAAEPDAVLAGFLYANLGGGWVLVNADAQNPQPRRRFTIAHELGHYLLHFQPVVAALTTGEPDDVTEFEEGLTEPADGDNAAITRSLGTIRPTQYQEPRAISPDELDAMETEADLFAAELLMPARTLQRLADQWRPRCGTAPEVLAGRLASLCLVSQQAMRRRLHELRLT